ncbi:unnamed protein product [Somion occarium]|uniref:AB hydrolase-1 domain-containing protein n=1 Tax=Somion occarium TaxID=3059160 RepID=A0ABP1D6X2_9APHY
MHTYLDWVPFSLISLVLVVAGWTWVNTWRRSKISLHHVPLSYPQTAYPEVKIPGVGDHLAALVNQKVPSLAGPEARLHGVWWLPGGNAQTLYTSLSDFSDVDTVTYQRKLLQVADGGVIAIDIAPPLHSHPVRDGETIILIAHGLTGGSHEHYVRSAVNALRAPAERGGLGARAVVMNFRGCNGSPVITPKLYHAGSSDDVRPIVLWITHMFPQSTIFGLGFSLGANVLTKYSGEEGEDCPLSGVVALANVWDWCRGSQYGLNGNLANRFVYRYVLADALRSLHHLHRHIFLSSPSSPLPVDLLEKLSKMGRITLTDFDNMITSKLYGFKDANDYYTRISSVKVLDNLRIPLLGINSKDDPILGKDNLPYTEASRNPWFVFATTEVGGHMGWFERQQDGSLKRWYVKPVKEFFSALLEEGLPQRHKPAFTINDQGMVQQLGNSSVAFREVEPESLKLFTSRSDDTKLYSGW